MAPPVTLDFALAYDPVARRCDMVFDGRDWAFDATVVTPLLIALGTERRADASDVLPEAVDLTSDLQQPGGRDNPRRGSVADALSPRARSAGSKLWLMDREKQTADTRIRAKSYALDAVSVTAARLGVAAQVDASWVRPGLLAILAKLGGRGVQLPVSLI